MQENGWIIVYRLYKRLAAVVAVRNESIVSK